ncbi:MAG: YlxR family protein [Clostridia bacterium]|nr:YlxR family protein [Clostridia bacterium]MBQ2252035.1 YlxR family protein [Clostridia bacterium]MBQ5601965.1 YlxR family protein [Clostridia bacterium]
MKPKKIPSRKCLGCMQSFPKKDLIRLVRSPEGDISLDFTGKKSGRGAYICQNAACFAKAKKAKRFEKNLECQIPEEVYLSLEEELKNNG